MNQKRCTPLILLISAALIFGAALPTIANQWKITQDDEWCERCSEDGEYCEVREIIVPARMGTLKLDASPNGGISVEGWDRDEILLRARVSVRSRKSGAAREIASQIEIVTDNHKIYADGPKQRKHQNWSVSYRLIVPRTSDLSLSTTNGGISISDVRGSIRFDATNGGIHLSNVSGDVSGETTNGSLNIELAGDTWEGDGLDVVTTNGAVRLEVPSDYSANLETSTTNGRVHFDFPVTVKGSISRHVSAVLGEGGPTIRVVTTNGGIKVYHQ